MKRQKRFNLTLLTLMAFLALPVLVQAGQLTPSAPPSPTMKSLDELYQKLSTLETKMNLMQLRLAAGSRFADNGNGTVTDTSTGLIWLKNSNPCGFKNWNDAMAYCANLASGQAGLTDGSVAGQWRLPTKEELEGIGTNPPVTWDSGFPSVTWTMPGAPFTNVQTNQYWSSTEYAGDTTHAWLVIMYNGYVFHNPKPTGFYVWPVRNQ